MVCLRRHDRIGTLLGGHESPRGNGRWSAECYLLRSGLSGRLASRRRRSLHLRGVKGHRAALLRMYVAISIDGTSHWTLVVGGSVAWRRHYMLSVVDVST